MKLAITLAAALAVAGSARADALDDLFTRYHADTPGCAIGIARAGQAPILRGYGSADLEHGVAITPDTIFEAGSVSKQFAAAAVLTLVADGKIALGDDIRKYLPEMPAYSAPITVDMLLSHTSGLRDWGEVEAIAGWPRTSRIYTHDEVLQIAARQKALNYAPGAAYSYTNTGYNLATIIVQRVSGKSLADFTAERLFKPLGMTHTGWRDDFRRIVPGRAQAYDRTAAGYALDMPFENVHGNSALLTTVGDLLIWNRALDDRKLGVVADLMQQPAVLTSGRKIEYARGLFVGTYRGLPEISHTGATAGYRAWIARYPSQGVSVAMLCNGSDADGSNAHKAIDPYLTGAQVAAASASRLSFPAGPTPTGAEAAAPTQSPQAGRAGIYIRDGELTVLRMAMEGERLRFQGGQALEPAGPGRYRATVPGLGAREIAFRPNGDMEMKAADGEVTLFHHETPATPTPADLAPLVGTYVSEEAGATLIASIKGAFLVLTPSDRPSAQVILNGAFKDGFFRAGGLIRFQRDKAGKVIGLSYQGGRVWDLKFRKIS